MLDKIYIPKDMITFKEKKYAIPALIGAMGGGTGLAIMGAGTGISAIQGHNANVEAEEQTEEMQRHNKQMEKIAKNQMESQKSFGMINLESAKQMASGVLNTVKKSNAGTLAKDMWSVHGEGIKNAVGFGAGMAGLGYIGNRAAQSWKDHDEGNDGKTGKALLKVAGTAAAVGGGLWAAKNGKLGFNNAAKVPDFLKKDTIQRFMSKEGTGGKALESLKKAANPIVRDESGNISKGATAGKIGMNALFAGMPVVGYAVQRGQQKDQIEAQQNYSDNEEGSGIGKKVLGGLAVAGTLAGGLYGAKRGVFGAGAQRAVGNAMASTGSYLGRFNATKGVSDKLINSGSEAYAAGQTRKVSDLMSKKELAFDADKFKTKLQDTRAKRATENPASLLTGTANAISKPLNWFGMMGSKGGVTAMKNTARKMVDPNKGEWSNNIGNWILKSDRNAALATIGGGVGAIGVGSTAMGLGDKAVRAVTKTVDNGAYDIEKEQEQKVYSKITFREKGEKVDKTTGLRTKFYKKETKVNKPGFHSRSVEITERSFTKWDQTDQIKGMNDSDILAEQKRPESSLSLGKSTLGAGIGAIGGGLAGKALGHGGTGALAGAAIGGMAGMDKQTREKTAIGAGLGAAAGMGLSLLTKRNLTQGAKLGAALGGTAGVISGVASGRKQNKENQFFNDRLEYAQNKALKREKADWKNSINNREGYSRW